MNNPFAPLLDFLPQGTRWACTSSWRAAPNGAGRAMNDPLLRRLIEVNTPALLLSGPPSEGHLFGNVKPRQLPPGRAQHITRRRTIQVQTALVGEEPCAESVPAAELWVWRGGWCWRLVVRRPAGRRVGAGVDALVSGAVGGVGRLVVRRAVGCQDRRWCRRTDPQASARPVAPGRQPRRRPRTTVAEANPTQARTAAVRRRPPRGRNCGRRGWANGPSTRLEWPTTPGSAASEPVDSSGRIVESAAYGSTAPNPRSGSAVVVPGCTAVASSRWISFSRVAGPR